MWLKDKKSPALQQSLHHKTTKNPAFARLFHIGEKSFLYRVAYIPFNPQCLERFLGIGVTADGNIV